MRRFNIPLPENAEILGEKLIFPSGKTASNRFMKAALTELLSTYNPEKPEKHGIPSQEIINLYQKWGNGQFGLILTGNVQVSPNHLESPGNAIIFKEGESVERFEKFKKYAAVTKEDGALAIMQLSHAGRQTPITVNSSPFSASNVKLNKEVRFLGFGKPIELSVEQIKTEVIDRFVYAAKIAFESGFDGIQLHGAHGYLLAQFTSPTTNKRTDRYGGSVENRQRIVVEVFEAIRKEIPASTGFLIGLKRIVVEVYEAIRKEIPPSTGFLIGLKTNSVEFQSEGTTVEEAIEMCKVYEKIGFDFVELSGGTYEHFQFEHVKESTKKREAFFLEFAEKIRPVFKNTVVYVTGGFRSVNAMVDAITSGATQGIGLGRPATAEPDLPKKILSKSVPSAIFDRFQNELSTSALASNIQMEQMGRNSMKNGNLMDGISDFSDEQTAQRFRIKMGEYIEFIRSQASKGIASPSFFVFEGAPKIDY